MDRAAVHKLEIGLNKNPTAETLDRYAGAMGKRIVWAVKDRADRPGAGKRTREIERVVRKESGTFAVAAAALGGGAAGKRKAATARQRISISRPPPPR